MKSMQTESIPREREKLVQRPQVVGYPENNEKKERGVWRYSYVQMEWGKDRTVIETVKISQ